MQAFSQLKSVVGGASVSLHLVEVSPALSVIQAQNLTGGQGGPSSDGPVYLRGETAAGLPVSWYRRLEDVPAGAEPGSVPRLTSTLYVGGEC